LRGGGDPREAAQNDAVEETLGERKKEKLPNALCVCGWRCPGALLTRIAGREDQKCDEWDLKGTDECADDDR